jgi:ribosomal protein S18 acetylase RimI-like enzyme
MKKLIDYADVSLLDLHLTVDSDNSTAIYLYKIFGFDIEEDLGDKYLMSRKGLVASVSEAEITVPVSIGEAVDKYTILQIKEAKIRDEEKLEAVKKEKEALSSSLGGYLEEYSHYVDILRDINERIWEDQDKFRASTDSAEQGKVCTKIIKDNDGRFRVKKKINSLVNSKFKEQKSYATKKCLLLGHLGMGDMVTMIGATRYLSIYYDEVLVVVAGNNEMTARSFYEDDRSIKFLTVKGDRDISPSFGCDPRVLGKFAEKGYEILKCGIHAGGWSSNPFYKQFYVDS